MSEGKQKKSVRFEDVEKLNEILSVLGKIKEEQEELKERINENQLNINEKLARMEIVQQQSIDELSKKQDEKLKKLEEGQKTIIEKLTEMEKLRVRIYDDKNMSRYFFIEVKKSDNIEILDSEVVKNFGFKPSTYFLFDCEFGQKKSPLFEEFEKLRKETAGINSIMQNPSSGLVSQTTLNEILEVLGKMSEKQEELEKQIKEDRKVQEKSTGELSKKIDEKLNTLSGKFEKLLEERINENRKVEEKLHENIINRISKQQEELAEKIMENRETQRKEENILSNNQVKIFEKLEKMEQGMTIQQQSTGELSKKVEKLEEGLKTGIEKLDQRPENSHQPNNSKSSINNPNIANQPRPPMNNPPMTNVSSELKKREKTEEQSSKVGESSSNQQAKEDDETIRILIIDINNRSRIFHIKVKKSDKIKILESEVVKNFGFKPSEYVLYFHPDSERNLNPESTFGENNLKDGYWIRCYK